MSRNSAQWTRKPRLPPTHYADPVILQSARASFLRFKS